MTRSRLLRTLPAISRLAAAAVAAGGVALSFYSARRSTRYLKERSKNRFTGKTVLITGGSRGLALAAEFAASGANLVLAARDESELLRARQSLVASGDVTESQVQLVPCDLTSREQAEAMIQAAISRWGGIDVLVNNAGIIRVGPASTLTVDDFIETMETNFFAMLYCTWAALPHMASRGAGDIVNISSFGGKVAVPHMLSYSASKFAATGFSEGLHTEVKSLGIHLTTVCPGLMRTGSHLNAEFKGRHEEEYRWFSLGAALPLVSVSASRAARLIVAAAARREAELMISPQAAIGVRLAGLMPNTTAAVLSQINRLLPDAGGTPGSTTAKPGRQSRGRELKLAGVLGGRAAARYNEKIAPRPGD